MTAIDRWHAADPRPRRQARIVALIRRAGRCTPDASWPSCSPPRGIEVTQATLSRDLEELGAVKVRGADGGAAVYVIPEDGSPLRGAEQAAPTGWPGCSASC